MHTHGALSRRQWLHVGGIGLLGLSLPHLLDGNAQAATATKRRHPSFGRAKSCMLILLKGGPSHLDTFDLKPEAPAEIRGQFKPIATSVPGIQVCEHLPNLAGQIHHATVVRSVHHRDLGHPSAAYEMTTGHPYPRAANQSEITSREDHPHVGSSVSAVDRRGTVAPAFVMVPDYLVVNGQHRSGQNAGFLGPRFDPLVAGGDASNPFFRSIDTSLVAQVESQRLRSRRALLAAINSERGKSAAESAYRALDDDREKAFDILESGRTRDAFNVATEPDAVRDRYGRNFFGQSLLLGRRLIEAGVRLVHVNCMSSIVGGTNTWDTHKDNFNILKNTLLPRTDQGVAALLADLAARGLLDETLVVVTGEFGRTPKINKDAGRDHWAATFCVLLAGAGIPGGRAFGASDPSGAFPVDSPISSGELAATIFHALGIDPATKLVTSQGRPWRICDDAPAVGLWA